HELERRVARREVEAGHVADARQAARKGDEEEQREDQRRQEQLRVGRELLDRAPRDTRDDVPEAPHVRANLLRSAVDDPVTPISAIEAANRNPSPSALPCHPKMIS